MKGRGRCWLCPVPSAPVSLGPGAGELPQGNGAIAAAWRGRRRREEKKKGGLLIATETEGAVVSFLEDEAEELLENILVSIGVATFKCGRGKGKGKGSGTHLFSIFT